MEICTIKMRGTEEIPDVHIENMYYKCSRRKNSLREYDKKNSVLRYHLMTPL